MKKMTKCKIKLLLTIENVGEGKIHMNIFCGSIMDRKSITIIS